MNGPLNLFENYLPFVCVVGLLLHNLQYSLACAGTIFRIAVDGDGLLEGAHIILPVDVDAGPTVLGDLSYRAALATDDGADHFAGHQQPQREVGLTSRAAASWHAGVLWTAAGASAVSFVIEQLHQQV